MGKKLSVLIIAVAVCSLSAAAQTAAPGADAHSVSRATEQPNARPSPAPNAAEGDFRPFQFGVGFKVSSLGFGGEAALSLTRKTNARFGFTAFNFGHDFDKDGINYNGTLGLKSAQALLDYFPLGGGFHISGGALIYNGNELRAIANVSGGLSFTLDGVDYLSSAASPVTGNGKLAFNKVSPMFLIGYGNLVPRSKHFSFSIEGGLAYHGSPKATLNLVGSACNMDGTNCRAITSDPTIQNHIQLEVDKLNHDASPLKAWPVISLGFGYRF